MKASRLWFIIFLFSAASGVYFCFSAIQHTTFSPVFYFPGELFATGIVMMFPCAMLYSMIRNLELKGLA